MRRRTFLKGAGSLSFLSTTALTTTFPSPARAELLSTIIAVMGFVNAVAQMFARPGGDASGFAILNAKLDAVLHAQQQTLQALSEISQQIAELKAALPSIEINEDLRQKYVDMLGALRRLRAALVEIELNNATDETVKNIDVVVQEVYKQSGDFVENLGTIQTGNPSDVLTLEFAKRTLAALKDFLPGFYAADKALGLQEERQKLHGQKYQFISNQTLLAITRLRKRTKRSLEYHLAQYDGWKAIVQDRPAWKQWITTIETRHVPEAQGEDRQYFAVAQNFGTMQYMGGCTNKANFRDVNDLMSHGLMLAIFELWSAFLLYVPGTLSGEASYYEGSYMGLLAVDFDFGPAAVTGSGDAALKDVGKLDTTDSMLTLPRRTLDGSNIGQYYCPGVADGDRVKHAGINAQTYRGALQTDWPDFQKAITWQTYENWVLQGLHLLDQELASLIVEAASVKKVTCMARGTANITACQ